MRTYSTARTHLDGLEEGIEDGWVGVLVGWPVGAQNWSVPKL